MPVTAPRQSLVVVAACAARPALAAPARFSTAPHSAWTPTGARAPRRWHSSVALLAGAAGVTLLASSAFVVVAAEEAVDTVEQDVVGADELADGQMKGIKVPAADGKSEFKLLVARVAGVFYCVQGDCSHYGVGLEFGTLVGERVTCPAHNAQFNVRTGEVLNAPALDPLHVYPVTVRDGRVIVTLPRSKPAAAKPKVGGGCGRCDKRTFVIVGGGAAAVSAAEALRTAGAFKGKVIMVTAEAHLPYDRPALSKQLVEARPDTLALRDEAFFAAHDIAVHRNSTVTGIDVASNTLSLSDGTQLAYDSVLIATGSTARQLPVAGAELDNVFTLRSATDRNQIAAAAKGAKSAVVVGSGFIGLEVASALHSAGVSNVTVVGMESVPLERVVGERVGAALQKFHQSKGVQFRQGAAVKALHGAAGSVCSVELGSGEQLAADVVVVGAGAVPATSFVSSSLPLRKDGSLLVEPSMKVVGTPNDNVYAAGDVAAFAYHDEVVRIEHWNTALTTGRVAAINMAGKQAVSIAEQAVPFFWTRFHNTSLTYAGHAAAFDDVVIAGDLDQLNFIAFYIRGDQVVAAAAVGRNKQIAAAAELLRAHAMPSAATVRKNPAIDLVRELQTRLH